MPDIPKTESVKPLDALQGAVTAGQAVRDGIATHAEKHKAAKQAAHHKAEADKKLSAKP